MLLTRVQSLHRHVRDAAVRSSSTATRAILSALTLLTFAVGLVPDCGAQLRLSRLISDGMVLQREKSVPVWGWAGPGAEVTVRFDDAEYTTGSDTGGEWSVVLPAMEAGGPHSMVVSSGANRIEVRDILVGDVWIASGQSNMEWTVSNSANAESEIAAASDAHIRHFKVPRSWSEQPESTLAGGDWEAASSQSVGDFSAVGYYFARELREHIGVPVGIINTSWGGSRIEPWMSADALGLDEAGLDRIFAAEADHERRVLDDLRRRVGGELPTEDGGLVNGRALWAAPELDDSDWSTIPVPSSWEQAGYQGMDGVAWYRTTFELSVEDVAAGARTIGLGIIDDTDMTWVNGVLVGEKEDAWNEPRVYDLRPGVVRPGTNVVTVRVEDTGGNGGITGSEELLFIGVAGERRSLAGEWKFRVGAASAHVEARKNQVATLLYNKMIHPLLPFPIAGAIWYQGESNASPDDAFEYRRLFADMITDWRLRWNPGGAYEGGGGASTRNADDARTGAGAQGGGAEAGAGAAAADAAQRLAANDPRTFPFLFVQLANFMETAAEPSSSSWAMLRESQSAALALPRTGQAVIIDIGEADDIHPRNKQDVGRRLALAARRIAYGQNVVASGPIYTGHQIYDGKVVLAFEHVGRGLVARGGPLSGFAIAGDDGQFVWADAVIEGDRVVVTSESVPDPLAVRYAWADNPEGANLYNAEGLPASPFRTDDWEE